MKEETQQNKDLQFTRKGAWLGFISYLIVILIVGCVFYFH